MLSDYRNKAATAATTKGTCPGCGGECDVSPHMRFLQNELTTRCKACGYYATDMQGGNARFLFLTHPTPAE